jgi:hypothetical protein
MLKEVILKTHDSAMDRRDLSTGGVFIPNEEYSFVDDVILVKLLV